MIVADRFWARVDRSAGPAACWPWRGPITRKDGYGRLYSVGSRLAHRTAYRLAVGPIPDGLTLDHLCHTADTACRGGSTCPHRRCCNPSHLEPITGSLNTRRSVRARMTHCDRGHEFNEANTYHRDGHAGVGQRGCRACNALATRRYRRRLSGRSVAA